MNSPARIVLLLSEFISGATMFHSVQPRPSVALNYIVYILDGDGKIRGADWIEASSDYQALVRASRIAAPGDCEAGGGCEVWQLDRRIGKIRPRSSGPV